MQHVTEAKTGEKIIAELSWERDELLRGGRRRGRRGRGLSAYAPLHFCFRKSEPAIERSSHTPHNGGIQHGRARKSDPFSSA